MPTVKKQASLQGALAALEANQEHLKAANFSILLRGFFGKSGCFWWRKIKTNPFKIHQNLVQESLVLETDAGEVASLISFFPQLRSLPLPTFATFAICELSKENWIWNNHVWKLGFVRDIRILRLFYGEKSSLSSIESIMVCIYMITHDGSCNLWLLIFFCRFFQTRNG